MKTRSVFFVLAGATLVAAGTTNAAVTDFTAGEGYTNGNLHGQVNWVTAWPSNAPNGFVVDTNAAGYNGALGTVSMSSNWAFWAESVILDDRGDTAVAKAVFRFDALGQTPAANGQVMTLAFLGTDGNDLLRATLRRTTAKTGDANRSRLSFQLASTGTGGQAAIALDQHYEVYTGLTSTGSGQSDWLEFTASLMRGVNRLDWKLEVVVKNLVTEEICIAGRWTIKTSSNFFNAPDYVARMDGQTDDQNNIVPGSRQIDSFEVYSYHQNRDYDEVCDGNIDGAKSNSEEVTGSWTRDSADPWYDWGYLGKTTFVVVRHDKYGKMGSHRDSDAAVTQTGRKWTAGLPRAVAINETIEWSVNYRMIARAGLVEQPHIDLYLTTQPLVTDAVDAKTKIAYAVNQVAEVANPDEYVSQLGCRISQDDETGGGNWPDGSMAVHLQHPLNYAGVGPTNLIAGWVNLNDIGISAGDPEGDHLNLTYRAKKTATNDLWDCGVTLSNRETGATWTFTENGVTNALLYNAATGIYPTVYDPKGFSGGTDGFEIDDLVCRILYVPAPFVSQVVSFDGSSLEAVIDGNGTVASLEYVPLHSLAAGSWTNVPGTEFTNDTPGVVTNSWPVGTTTDDRAYRIKSDR